MSVCVSVFFSPFNIAITLPVEQRANLSAFRTFVRFALVWFCLFPLPLGVWEGLRLMIVAHPGLFSYLYVVQMSCVSRKKGSLDFPSNQYFSAQAMPHV